MSKQEYIGFNKPFLTGNELKYIDAAVQGKVISGDGAYTKKCQSLLEKRYGFRKTLLTTSCTDALELAALLLNIQPGDEVIMPSYTFVSTANAFILRGATIRFADSLSDHPNVDTTEIEKLITDKTRAIVPVHYAGLACNMDRIGKLAAAHGIAVVEDAAQCIDSYYNGVPLGALGTMSAFSFHETKNVISGEGGMLVINDEQYIRRAEIIREKGTNRSSFFRGEIDKYGWVDVGSSFLPTDIVAAFLYAQLENIDRIQEQRLKLWNRYATNLNGLAKSSNAALPTIPEGSTNNGHIFYLVCDSLPTRSALIAHLKANEIQAVFHYLPLHSSPYFNGKHDGRQLPNCDRFADGLVRLPMYFELTISEIDRICECILEFYRTHR